MANTAIEVRKSAPLSTSALSKPNGDIFESMRQEMERLFNRFSGFDIAPFGRDIEQFWARPNGGMLPVSVDVAEDDKAYTVTAELPGIEEKDLDVSITEGVMTVKGEKRAEKEEKNKNHYVCERSFGSFQRSFALPADIDAAKIDAAFSKGVLTITLPKNPKAQPATKKIDVKTV